VRIYAIQTGTVQVKKSQPNGTQGRGYFRLLNTLLDQQWTEPLPILAWLIEHPEGNILIDTGETSKTSSPGYLPRWHPYYQMGVRLFVEPSQEINVQLAKLGFLPEDIRWVIMTHLHTDHAGGLYHFQKSEFIISRDEIQNASGFKGRINGYLSNHWPDWFSPTIVDYENIPTSNFMRSHVLTRAGDVHIIPTPGHTEGHQSVILLEEDLSYFFAGDLTYSQQLLLNYTVDGVTHDPDQARSTLSQTLTYIAECPTVYLPSHDPESTARLHAQQRIVKRLERVTAEPISHTNERITT